MKHQSECTKFYSISGVPHLMIIDTSGKIAFKGNPINRPDLEADVTDLIQEIPLVGEGCAPIG